MARPSTTKLALSALAVGAATAAIFVGSTASWTASTSNPSNSVSAATFNLTNSKNSAAVFTAVTNAKPGDSGSDTVTVTNANGAGGLPMAITLAQTNETASNALSGALKLKIHDDTTNTCVWPAEAFGGGACSTYAAWEGGAGLDSVDILKSAGGDNQWPATQAHTFTVSWSFPSTTTGTTGAGQSASFDLEFNGAQV